MTKLVRVIFIALLLLPLTAFAQTADLEIVSAVDSPDPVTPGAALTYTVTLTNHGPDPAPGGGVNFNLPGAVTYNGGSGAGFTCVYGFGGTCNMPSLPVGTYVVIINTTVNASLASFPDQTISANFFPSGTAIDPNTGNNSKNADTQVNSPQVDLSLTASDSPDPVFPDGTVTYTVDVTNGGPDTASSVNFNVVPNPSLAFTSVNVPAGWNCVQPSVGAINATFTCSRATWAPGTSQFIVVFTANDEQFGINDTNFQTNFSVNAGASNETDNTDNSVTLTTAYQTPDADVTISVSDSPDPVAPDGNITYTVTVGNTGPDTAPNITLNSFGANDLRYMSHAAPPGWNCTVPASGTQTTALNCTLPAGLPSGGSSVLTFVMQADDAFHGTMDHNILFGFQANSSISDPDNSDNSETESTLYTTADADINVTVSDSPDPVSPDGNITYTVTVTNQGPDTAPSVSLSSFGANDLRYISSIIPGGWSCTLPASGTQTTGLSCTGPSMANGASAVLTFTMQADDAFHGINDHTILFGFTASSPLFDPDGSDNSETESTQYDAPTANLGVSASDSPDPVTPGNNITYTGSVVNAGPDAVATQFQAILHPSLRFKSLSGPAGFTCTMPSVDVNGTITCNLASFASGPSVPFTLVAEVDPALNSGADGVINQTFTIGSTVAGDPAPSDNSVTVSTQYVTPDADISLSTGDSPDPVVTGGTITYTHTVTNNGPDSASSVTFSQSTPAGTTFQSFTAPPGWICTTPSVGGTGTINCSIATLPNGGTGVITVVLNVTGSGPINSTATASSSTNDPNPGNGTTTPTTTVNAPTTADLTITKTTATTTAPAGSTFSYTISVTNNGPDAAANVVVTDTLPASLLFRSITQPSPFTCTTPAVGTTGTITCNAASLANGQTRSFTLVVEVASGATGSINNGASATSAASDSTPASASAPSVAAAPAAADLSISKTTTATQAENGGTISYTITVNNAGPSPATNVVVTDDLPSTLAFLSATPSQGTCNASDPVSCNLGTIPAGGSATVTLQATVIGTNGTVTNTANVSSSEGDSASSTTPAIPIVPPGGATPIPTASEWALIALGVMLAAVALKGRM